MVKISSNIGKKTTEKMNTRLKKKLNQTKNIKNKVSYNKKIKKIIKTARQKYTSEPLQDAKNAIQEKKCRSGELRRFLEFQSQH